MDAFSVRREWMRLQGLSEEEIAEYCDPNKYDADLEDELKQLEAMKRILERETKQ